MREIAGMPRKKSRTPNPFLSEAPQAAYDDDARPRQLQLARWLAAARMRKGKLAEAIGKDPSYITMLSKPESYKKKPSYDVLRSIADVLGDRLGFKVQVEELYGPPPGEADIQRAEQLAERIRRYRS